MARYNRSKILSITAAQVQELRKLSGAGIMDCRAALTESHGDVKLAFLLLRKRDLARARGMEGKPTGEGLVLSYVHPGHKVGALVEVNCQSDFVARTPEFRELCKDISMQIVASAPKFISREDIPQTMIKKEKEIYRSQAVNANKPPKVIDKIVSGKLEKYFGEICLLEQPFIKDTSITVREYLDLAISRLAENIVIRRFVRYKLGEELKEGIAID